MSIVLGRTVSMDYPQNCWVSLLKLSFWMMAVCCFYLSGAGTSVAVACQGEDVLELISGENIPGSVIQIRKTEQQVNFKATSGDQRIYDYAEIHAVTYRGKRFVLTPMSEEQDKNGASEGRVTREEVRHAIRQAGQSPPDWFDSVALDYPKSLDLQWPLNASGGWNNQKNMGQYLWDVVYPNQHRWKPGIKLIHRCLELHKDDPALLKRDMNTLGTMYFTLLQDYRRAAFWLEKTKPAGSTVASVRLAECYWRLGDTQSAMKLLNQNRLPVEAIKLLGEMKDLSRMKKLVGKFDKTGRNNEAWLAAAEAYRSAGEFEEAVNYYQKVLENKKARDQEYLNRFHQRAAGGIESIRLLERAKPQLVADGKYQASSVGYNGQLDVEVTIADGKVVEVKVLRHREKQFYAALEDTPQRIIDAQSVEGIDGTSGATITSQAILHATSKALADAPRK